MDTHPGSSADQSVDAEGLARLASEAPERLRVIDCRTEGTPIKNATRVRLPAMMLRRLEAGTMPITQVCPGIAAPEALVVVVPESPGIDGQMSRAVRNVLQAGTYCSRVFDGDIEEACRVFPCIRAPAQSEMVGGLEPLSASVVDAGDSASSSGAVEGETGWMNLKSLRLDPEALAPKERTRQIFPVRINDHLFLGNAETAGNYPFLKELGITHIVNVTSNLPNAFEAEGSFRYLRISVDDNCSHNLSAHFPEAISFIQSAADSGGKCLVHCLAGISRSVTVCIAYLMSSLRFTLEEAYDHVLSCNAASIAPNFHFMGQLSEFERTLGLSGRSSQSSRSNVSVGAPPPSPSCGVEAVQQGEGGPRHQFPPSACLTPPPTSCSVSPQSSAHSHKSTFD